MRVTRVPVLHEIHSLLLSIAASLFNPLKSICDYESFVVKLTKCQSANKLVYTKMNSTKSTLPTHYNQQKWQRDCNQNDVDSMTWRDAYHLASKYSKSTRILDFQYKLLHRRVAQDIRSLTSQSARAINAIHCFSIY